MKQYLLIGISIIAMILLVLGSLTNVIGYQTVQSSNQQIIKEEVNQRELLFQTIVDIANNKEIQRIILKYQMSSERFLDIDIKFPAFNKPVLTKSHLKQMYHIGLMFSKIISKSRMQSIIERYKFSNQEVQKEITTVIEKDPILKREILQLSNAECDCENDSTTRWRYPIICSMFSILSFGLGVTFAFFDHIISDGELRNNPILIIMAVLIWLEAGSLWVTVDSLIDIYCETDLSTVSENTT